jgi:alanyl-tRNA synthetase
MNSSEIRSRFLQFFKNRNHAILQSASLVTSDEKGVTNPTLFNTAGMQPLLGKEHPLGKRLADSQKCLRTVDIDSVGDNTHATFFEMLGNWSLGDYFKEDAIAWSFEFLTSKDNGLGLDPKRLYVTVFEGDQNAPRDDEAFEIWKKYIPQNRIYFMSAQSNWWEAGDNGPCGPDTEMYYDVTPNGLGDLDKDGFIKADDKRDVVEIWNDVFMQYEKKDGRIIGKLPKPSVDTGAGLERLSMVMQKTNNIYNTDLFAGVMSIIESNSVKDSTREKRIIADHVRASTFLISDGVGCSNTGRGYILRRLLRRAIRYAKVIDLKIPLSDLVDSFASFYHQAYPELQSNIEKIKTEINKEYQKFTATLEQALKEFNKISTQNISGVEAFRLFSTFGLPIDTITDLAKERSVIVDTKSFEDEFKKHQELSRVGAEQKFKGGLADSSNEMVVRYHTATHLLHQALFDVLGDGVMQKGSNITEERLRFDFAYGSKMTDEQKSKVEQIVNSKIEQKIPVNMKVLSFIEAEKTGAKHFFGEKYGDEVSVYYIGNDIQTAYSKEFCGGPHVKNTFDLAGPEGKWRFKIQKEEAVAQGIRRIKAVLQ